MCIMSFINASVVFSKELFINEIQVANIDRFIDPSYNYGGWIELYNPEETSVLLSGYTIRHTTSDGRSQYSLLSSYHFRAGLCNL